jgi:hypothetical protein
LEKGGWAYYLKINGATGIITAPGSSARAPYLRRIALIMRVEKETPVSEFGRITTQGM